MRFDTDSKLQILTASQMHQKVKRMAVEIYERNFDFAEVTIVGISHEGYVLSNLLSAEISRISPIKVQQAKLTLDKTALSQPAVGLDIDLAELAGKPLILVDDVLNTGRTLWFALNPFTAIALPKIEVAVMVARNHSLFPIKADIVGYGISTTLSNHVKVVMDDAETMGAYLI